jgi:glutamate-1-semialdehyde 2,1-aminomutase
MFSVFFTTAQQVINYEDVCQSDINRFKQFFHHMLEQQIYFPPSAFETCFSSAAHNQEVIERTCQAANTAFSKL